MTTPTIDAVISQLFAKLAERKASLAELKAAAVKSWKTNGTFRLIGASATTNIQTASQDIIDEVIIHLFILINGRQQASTFLKRAVGVKVYGYSSDDWFSDIEKRIATISIRDEEKELEALETRLNSVLSPEERRRIEVQLLAAELG
jgi:hypothetical protein